MRQRRPSVRSVALYIALGVVALYSIIEAVLLLFPENGTLIRGGSGGPSSEKGWPEHVACVPTTPQSMREARPFVLVEPAASINRLS
jgi:hypothetical protein